MPAASFETEKDERHRGTYLKINCFDLCFVSTYFSVNCIDNLSNLLGKFLTSNPSFPVLQTNLGLVSSCHEKSPLSENGVLGAKSDLPSSKKLKSDENKHSIDELFQKGPETVIIESDDEMQIDRKPGEGSSARVEKVIDIIDIDDPSQSPKLSDKSLPKSFKCTICTEILNASEVHRHPVLDVTVCGPCRFLVIEKNRLEVTVYLLFIM